MPRFLALLVTAACLGACAATGEEVRFHNGAVTLSGTLLLPPGAGPHPAVVLIHGDGPETRQGYRHFAQLFARHGVAALIYDKRGEGASSGDWRASRFSDLADDALAGLRLLQGRADIDPRRIGLWGGSQGGWIAALAASRSPDVAFLILKSTPAVGPAQLATYKSVTRVRNAGYTPEVTRQVEALMALQVEIVRNGRGWERLATAVEPVRDEPWYRHVAVMRHSGWDSSWMTYGPDIDFDPLPIFEALRIPVLSIWGENDPETPVQQSAAILQAFRVTRGRDITIMVFPGADHQVELPRTRENRPRFAPGFLEGMIDWTLARVQLKR